MPEHDHGDDVTGCIDRRRFVQGCGATIALAAAGTAVGTASAEGDGSSPVGELLADLPDNWGRWGDDDELGALNFLGSEEAFEGMNAATRRGKRRVQRYTLQTPITGEAIDALVGQGSFPTTDTGDPFFPGRAPARRDNVEPSSTETGVTFADDRFVTPLYLQGTTHVDALGHAWYDGQLYNGFDAATTDEERSFEFPVRGLRDTDDDGTIEAADVTTTRGLGRNDVANAAGAGIAGRGVLLDVGREFGDEDGRLPFQSGAEGAGGFSITLDHLLDTARSQGVRLRERDVLLIRTGSLERTRDPEAEWDAMNEPGLAFSEELVRWAHEMEIPLVGADNLAVEKVVSVVDDTPYVLPLHGAFLRDLGVTFNEILDLSALAAQCAEDGIYDFLFTAAPLHVERATGAPANPVVLKAVDEAPDGK